MYAYDIFPDTLSLNPDRKGKIRQCSIVNLEVKDE